VGKKRAEQTWLAEPAIKVPENNSSFLLSIVEEIRTAGLDRVLLGVFQLFPAQLELNFLLPSPLDTRERRPPAFAPVVLYSGKE